MNLVTFKTIIPNNLTLHRAGHPVSHSFSTYDPTTSFNVFECIGVRKRPLPKHNLLRKQCLGCLGTFGVTDPVYFEIGFAMGMGDCILYVSLDKIP